MSLWIVSLLILDKVMALLPVSSRAFIFWQLFPKGPFMVQVNKNEFDKMGRMPNLLWPFSFQCAGSTLFLCFVEKSDHSV